jgi:hypothetical protein
VIAKLLIVLALGVAAALPATAAAAPSDADCTTKAKKAYKKKVAFKKGLKVTVSCDAPATVFMAVNLIGKADRYINPRVHPGSHGFSKTVDTGEDGKATLVVKLKPWAKRAVKKNGGKAKILFIFGIERDDGYFHNIPTKAAQPYSKIVP